MIESMEQLTSKKESVIPGKITVFWLVPNALAWFRCHINDRKKQHARVTHHPQEPSHQGSSKDLY